MDATFKHFIICGGQRCGTTFLTRLLSAHPKIQMAKPARPEPKFFLTPKLPKNALGEYRSLFFKGASPSEKIYLGEKSTSYIESDVAVKNIKNTLPDVKLIFLFRCPIERALSNIAFSRMNGFEQEVTEIAITRELDSPENMLDAQSTGVSVSPHAYLKRGCYAKFLPSFLNAFERTNIHMDLMENLIGCPNGISKIYNFLGLEPCETPELQSVKVNASNRDDEEQLSAETISRLNTFFEPHNKSLEEMTGLDLSPWKQDE